MAIVVSLSWHSSLAKTVEDTHNNIISSPRMLAAYARRLPLGTAISGAANTTVLSA